MKKDFHDNSSIVQVLTINTQNFRGEVDQWQKAVLPNWSKGSDTTEFDSVVP